ncbi:unnamed protein product [Mucor fragilis]
MKSLATIDDPSNPDCYDYEFIIAETQYEMMEDTFPNLKQHCSIERLQHRVGQFNIWGPRKRTTVDEDTKYGRQLWILRKEMREFLAESSHSISSYWDHLRDETDYITVGYARKSPH